ncbi:Uncharacterised protein [Chlamydia trachomatis]|nr:Uncharacterised protein [Chlamydia trachomatis]
MQHQQDNCNQSTRHFERHNDSLHNSHKHAARQNTKAVVRAHVVYLQANHELYNEHQNNCLSCANNCQRHVADKRAFNGIHAAQQRAPVQYTHDERADQRANPQSNRNEVGRKSGTVIVYSREVFFVKCHRRAHHGAVQLRIVKVCFVVRVVQAVVQRVGTIDQIGHSTS